MMQESLPGFRVGLQEGSKTPFPPPDEVWPEPTWTWSEGPTNNEIKRWADNIGWPVCRLSMMSDRNDIARTTVEVDLIVPSDRIHQLSDVIEAGVETLNPTPEMTTLMRAWYTEGDGIRIKTYRDGELYLDQPAEFRALCRMLNEPEAVATCYV